MNPTLTASVSVAADATTVCQGTSVTFTATPTEGGTTPTYQWYNGVTAITGATSVTYAYTPTPGNSDHITVQMTSNATPCLAGSPATSSPAITITVNPLPTITADNNGPICAGTSLTLTASTIASATYSWTGPNGYSSSVQNPTVSLSAITAMGGTYSVTATLNGCISSPGTTIAVVKTLPTAPTAGNNGPVNVGATLSLTASAITDATYAWTGPNSYSSASQNPTVSLSATTAMGGTYSVTATVNGCTGATGTTEVVVNGNSGPTNGGTIAASQTICSGSTPEGITNSTLPSGYTGTLQYKWQSSVSPFTSWSDIGSSNSATYNPGSLLATTWYKRLARTGTSTWVGAAESNVVKITIDITAPVAVAKNSTVMLNSLGTYTLLASDVLSSWSDAGVGLSLTNPVIITPSTVSCVSLGQTLTVGVVVTDKCGNSSSVTSLITVAEGNALPSPWYSCIIGASNGIATYSPCTGAGRFTLSSTGYSSPSADVNESVYQGLSGNGYIIAQVYSLSGNGWAGVQIRENCSAGSKKVLLKTQLQTFLRSEVRSTTGGATVSTQILRAGVKWLKISRTGNRFDAFTSADGVGWMSAFSTTMTMATDVQIGIFTEGINFTSTTTAKFDHVSVTIVPKSMEAENVDVIPNLDRTIDIYPNPASELVTILIPEISSKVKVSIISSEGKTVHSETIENTSTQVDVSNLYPGVYILRFDFGDAIVTKRLIVL